MKIWWNAQNALSLHSQFSNGSVAQLNRVPHYGCGGYGFESRRSHKEAIRNGCLFFCACATGLEACKALVPAAL